MSKEKETHREVRCFDNPVQIEIRKDGEGNEKRTITGYAAVFNQLSRTIGWFREKIEPGAFEGRLADDVVALYNHDFNKVLARTISETLKLEVDDTGLRYEFEAPNTTTGNDLVEMVRRGDIQHSSFSFSVLEENWEEDEDGAEIRTILKVKRLYDVSPVTFPAYLQTNVDVAKRSYEEWKESRNDNKPKYDPDSALKDAHDQIRAKLNLK